MRKIGSRVVVSSAVLCFLVTASPYSFGSSATRRRADSSRILRGPNYSLRVPAGGGLEIVVGRDRYVLETRFSYPGESIGWNRLTTGRSSAAGWTPEVTSAGDRTVVLSARSAGYVCTRTIRVVDHRVIVTDALANIGQNDVGIIYVNELSSDQPFQERLFAGTPKSEVRLAAENPSVFVAGAASRLGWLAEDDVLRLQLGLTSPANNRVEMTAGRFAIRPGERYTFRWALYPISPQGDYWSFINQVRRDWDVNQTVQGPFDYLDVTQHADLIRDPLRLKAYLQRKRLKVIALMPFVDYDNYSYATGRPLTRPELKAVLQEARDAIKRVDPSILTIGCIEGNLVSLPEGAQQALWHSAPNLPQDQYPLSDDQMRLLDKFELRWKDSLLQDKNGRHRYELYYRGPDTKKTPMISIAVYAAPGNGQHRYWLDQAKFLLEEVGLDGLYIDQFSLAFDSDQRYSYDRWDNRTVDIDPGTGRITARYTDAALVGAPARKDLSEYVMRKGVYMLANTYPAVSSMQTVRIHRFNESESGFNPFSWADGEMPPLNQYLPQGHLSTPVALGVRPVRFGEQGVAQYARVIMRAAIEYLRHGMLYYHYQTEIPESGPGAGSYGAINEMFPLTPIELHPGWVRGKERIVTCVSADFHWTGSVRPLVHVFDLNGDSLTPDVSITGKPHDWRVQLRLKDWMEIGVIESGAL